MPSVSTSNHVKEIDHENWRPQMSNNATELVNFEEYYVYADFVRYPESPFTINVKDITLDTYYDHLRGIFNIILDGIGEDIIVKKHITVDYGVMQVNLSTIDYWYNVIMWYGLLRTKIEIQPCHTFFDHKYLTQSTIKDYLDKYVISVNRKRYSNLELNNILNDCLVSFGGVDEFSFYLMNTINLKDDIDLMNANKEYYNLLHSDLASVPLEDEKRISMDLTNRGIDIIKQSGEWLDYEHCLADSFRSKQGINDRQYKEFNYYIGPKPRDDGEIWPEAINSSFTGGGVGDPLYYMIDSSAGRTAQMMSKINVGASGNFARLLGLNNTDTFLYPEISYDCCTKNYEIVHIKSPNMLNLLIGRYYRMNENGMEHIIDTNSTALLGKTICLRSPITCASNARGEGICYKCYGDLAYTNNNINIGKMAADLLSSRLTQRLLSAKHLLEAIIVKMKWSTYFDNIFEVEGNAIKMLADINPREWTMIIDPELIEIENEYDYSSDYDDGDSDDVSQGSMYNEYITQFEIENKRGERHIICTEGKEKLYITTELNNVIRSKAKAIDDKLYIPMSSLENMYLFFVAIHNNQLSKTMELLMDILNKNAVTVSMNRNQILQSFLEALIEGGLYISAVHCELLLSNQIRAVDDVLSKPDWSYPNAPYQVMTLNSALNNNPSIIIVLMYQRLSKALYNPLSFKKSGASFLDLFFFENAAEQLNPDNVTIAKIHDDGEKSLIKPLFKYERAEDED